MKNINNVQPAALQENIFPTMPQEEFQSFFEADNGLLKMIETCCFPSFSVHYAVKCNVIAPSSTYAGTHRYFVNYPVPFPNMGPMKCVLEGTNVSGASLDPSRNFVAIMDDDGLFTEYNTANSFYKYNNEFRKGGSNGISLIWPYLGIPAGTSISTTNVIQGYSLKGYSGNLDTDDIREGVPPGCFKQGSAKPFIIQPARFISWSWYESWPWLPASGFRNLQKWCDQLLYTPLVLWSHNSSPQSGFFNSNTIHTPTYLKYGSSNSSIAPVGYVGKSVYSVTHWVPFRKGCPAFCNTLHIAFITYLYRLPSASYYYQNPVMTIRIGRSIFTSECKIYTESLEDFPTGDNRSSFRCFVADFQWTDDGTSVPIGDRNYWPVQILDIYIPYGKTAGVFDLKYTECVQSLTAWIGGTYAV